MRKMYICFAAAATVGGMSGMASARAWRPDFTAVPFYQSRVVELQARINRLAADHAFSDREADRLRGQAAGLRAFVGMKALNGLNTAERIEIDLRISRLARQVEREANGGERR